MRWWQRLEVWVLLLSTLLPFFGILSVSFGVLHLMRQGLLTVARQQSESTAEIITRSVERVMKEGRADITRALVEDLRSHAGVAGVDVLNDAGREAFAKGTDAPESEALDRLRADPVPFSVQRGERLLFYLPLLNGPNCRSCHGDAKNLLGATKVSIPLGEGCRQIRLALVPVVDLPRIYRVLALRFGVVPLESPARMHRPFGATLLATALRRDKPFQHAAIICRRDARIRALPDLRGRSFAFGDINSTSSHIVPRAMLLEAGVGIEHLGSFEYLGHHDAVAAAVLRGDYDAGAAMESVAARYEPRAS